MASYDVSHVLGFDFLGGGAGAEGDLVGWSGFLVDVGPLVGTSGLTDGCVGATVGVHGRSAGFVTRPPSFGTPATKCSAQVTCSLFAHGYITTLQQHLSLLKYVNID